MLLLYNLFIWILQLGIRLAAPWNKKAAESIAGRKHWEQNLAKNLAQKNKIIWMHCASAGELEQGKPVIEKLKEIYPDFKIVVSFFSPSGYKSGEKYSSADAICYLPFDTKKNAEQFIKIVQPQLVIFVKYEYWYHHLSAVKKHKIPLLLVSSIFRKEQLFFKWYGSFYRNILTFFTTIFTQDETSIQLLNSIGITHCRMGGDTRFDRVATIIKNPKQIEGIEAFKNGGRLIIAGSTWPDDEVLFSAILNTLPQDCKVIIAPHEINETHLSKLQTLFPTAQFYSKLHEKKASKVLIIDNMGMLSRLYQYADITYIGGGFNGSGIHNTLEAAVWGKPVIVGPNYQKFREARDLINDGAAFSITTDAELQKMITSLLSNKNQLLKSSTSAALYIHQNNGATEKIMDYIQENRLLTTA